LSAILLSVSAASYGQQQEKVTWAEAVGYVAQHGTAFSFYGPVAKTLGGQHPRVYFIGEIPAPAGRFALTVPSFFPLAVQLRSSNHWPSRMR